MRINPDTLLEAMGRTEEPSADELGGEVLRHFQFAESMWLIQQQWDIESCPPLFLPQDYVVTDRGRWFRDRSADPELRDQWAKAGLFDDERGLTAYLESGPRRPDPSS